MNDPRLEVCRKCEGPFPSFEKEMQHIAFHAYITTRARIPQWRDEPQEDESTAWSRLLSLLGVRR